MSEEAAGSVRLEQVLINVIGNAVDLAALAGTGQNNQPTGIINQSNVHNVTLATPSSAPKANAWTGPAPPNE